jgi:SAM-dependent methyltransferase
MKPNQICPICQADSSYLLAKDDYDFYRCLKCGLVFVWPVPNLEFLSRQVYSPEVGYQGNKAKILADSPLPRKQVPILETLAKLKPNGRLLDVGCSNGQFIYWAKEQGLRPVGVELNPGTAAIAKANGLEVYQGTLAEAHFPAASFDLIFLGDLIEHVSDPRALVKEVERLLAPGGYLAIVTPNLDCFWSKSTWNLYRWFKIPWASLTPPHHLCQFSTGNLSQLLESGGFLVERTWYHQPGLKYELGMTHLWGVYKWRRKWMVLFYVLFAYTLYTLLFSWNYLTHLIRRTDFGLILIAKKVKLPL